MTTMSSTNSEMTPISQRHSQADLKYVASLKRLYADDQWRKDQYGLPRVRDLLSQAGVLGVTRLTVFTEFDPEAFLTCVFRERELRVSLAVGATSLGWSIPRLTYDGNDGGRPIKVIRAAFDPAAVHRSEAILDVSATPESFRSWKAIEFAAQHSPSCCVKMVLGGQAYQHRATGPSFETCSEWSNPEVEPTANASQITLLRAYRDLFLAAGIRVPYLPGKTPGGASGAVSEGKMVFLSTRRSAIILWTAASTILIEALTIYLRFGRGVNATEFNKTAPLLLQIHHMFYSIPLLLVVPFLWRKPAQRARFGHRLGLDPQRPLASLSGAAVDRGQHGLALAMIARSSSALVLSLQRIARRPKRNSQLIAGQEVGAFFPRTFRHCLSRR